MNKILQFFSWMFSYLSPHERAGEAGVSIRGDKNTIFATEALVFNRKPSTINCEPAAIFLFVLITLYSVLASAQNFPVQVIPQTIPPAPIYVSNYADASTLNGPLRVQIILNDFDIANREIRLKTYFTGSGLSFQSNDLVVGASPLFLEGGVPLVLTHVELAPYFDFNNITGISPNQYGNAIPEGAYQFCVEVYDVLTGSRLSNKSCALSVVFQNEPPFLVLPRSKTNVDEVNPQYIVFQWTPRSINVSNVEYELSLVEIWDTQVDPQQAFLSSPPVFQTTTSATTYLYGPSDPLLLSGKNYAWRVQAKAKQGTEEIGLFKNQGNSEIFSFSYAGSCDLPLGINHEVKGSTNANILWDDLSTEIPEFTVRYRQKGNNNEWFESKTAGNFVTLWDLKAGTIYEYQVRKKCSVTESNWSLEKQFTTFIADDEASVYDCGIQPDFSLTNQDPLPTIGDKFTAGDFPIKVLEASGSNGRFTGKGYVTIPYLNSIRVGVEFTNVLINTDNQLLEGSVITMYDASLSNILDIDAAIDTFDDVTDAVGEVFEGENDLDEMRVNFAIPKNEVNSIIKIVDGNVVITNPENGESISEPLGDDKVVVDGTGQVYHIDAGGNITEGGQIDPGGSVNSGNVDGVSNNGQIEQLTAEGILVTFNTPSSFGFDQMPSTANEKLKKEYTITKDAKGNDYVLPHHSVKKGHDTQITATITLDNNNYSAEDVIFKTKQGEVIPKTVSGNSVTLTIKGTYTFENETIYAVVPSKEEANKQLTAGAFTLWHLTDRVVDVVLVSVNNASLGSIENTVKNIYQKGVATINFGTPLALTVTPSSLGSNGLDVGESAWAAAYNEEQKQLVSAVQKLPEYKSDTYYILVFGDIQPSRSIAGFMPLQRQIGFVFSGSGDEEGKGGDKGKVLAHELGHGVFALQHPFGQYGSDMKNKTDWLMDYDGGTALPYKHWKQIHDPALKFYVFQDEEDGELGGQIWLTKNWKPFSFNDSRKVYDPSETLNEPNGTVPGIVVNEEYIDSEGNSQTREIFYEANGNAFTSSGRDPLDISLISETSLKSDTKIYLYDDNGSCGQDYYYWAYWSYVKGKSSIDFTDTSNVFGKTSIPCISENTSTDYSVCDGFQYLDETNEQHINLKDHYQKELDKALNKALTSMPSSSGSLVRDKSSINHIQFANTTELAIPESELQRIEDKLHLLSFYQPDTYMAVTFLKVQNNLYLSDRLINEMAFEAIKNNEASVGSKNVIHVVVPYANYQSILGEHTSKCYNIGFAKNKEDLLTISSVGGKKSIRDDIVKIFRNVEKPIFVKQYLTKADGSFLVIQQKAGDSRNYNEIHLLQFYNSSYIETIQSYRNQIVNLITAHGRDENPTNQEIYEYVTQVSDLNSKIAEAYDTAQYEESDINVFANNTWQSFTPTNIVSLREVFVVDNEVSTAYYASQMAYFSFIEVASIYLGNNQSLNSDIHFYEFDGYTFADPLIYGLADAISMIPVPYVDNIGDGLGLLYGTYRGNSRDTPFYAVGLAMPIGAGYLKKGRKGIENLYVVVGKKLDNGEILLEKKLRSQMDSGDIQITSVLSSNSDDADKALREVENYRENAEKYVRGFLSKKEKLLELVSDSEKALLKADLDVSDDLVDALTDNPILVDSWKFLDSSPQIRKVLSNLENLNEVLDVKMFETAGISLGELKTGINNSGSKAKMIERLKEASDINSGSSIEDFKDAFSTAGKAIDHKMTTPINGLADAFTNINKSGSTPDLDAKWSNRQSAATKQEKIVASELLAESRVDQIYESKGWQRLDVDGVPPGKQGKFDRVYAEFDTDGDLINLHLVEAKGGGSTLSPRTISDGTIAQQGTRQYQDNIIDTLLGKNINASLRKALETGQEDGLISYVLVNQKIDAKSNFIIKLFQ